MAAQLAIAAGMAGLQLVQGLQQAETIRANSQLTKQINDMNAEYAELDSYNAELDGYSEEARYQTAIDATISAQNVAFAAQGVDSTFGTAAQLQAESKINAFLNKADIINQAHSKALGYQNQARQIRLSGKMADLQAGAAAQAAQTAGVIGAAKSLAPQAAKSLSGYMNKPKGHFGGGASGNYAGSFGSEESYNIQYGGAMGSIA